MADPVLFPVGLGVVVYEKEMRLRMMKLMGLTDSVYWMVTYLYNLVIYCLFMIMLYIAGNLIGLAFFQLNSSSLQFLFYFIYGHRNIHDACVNLLRHIQDSHGRFDHGSFSVV